MKLLALPLLATLLFAAPVSLQAQETVQSVAEFAYITDFESGRVLLNKNGDAQMKPASMAKRVSFSAVASS